MKLLALLLLFMFSPIVPPVAASANDLHGIDFKNRSYTYRFSWGKHRRINIPLENGRFEYDFRDERGWFDLSHVYVTDLTNDRRPEAIVMLWHVACGVSCDGGSALFYIYSFDNHRLKPIWQYETGSLAYGCGLKSFRATRTGLTLELFARCSKNNRALNETALTGKFQMRGVTRVTFKSNGARFIARERKFVSSPERSVLSYEPQISVDP